MTSTTEQTETRVRGERVVASLAGEADEAIVCVHGLASQRASLGPLVDVLAERGYRALAPDLRGHGDSEGPRGRISQQRALTDLRAWEQHLREEHGARVRAIVGHSLGGLWAMAASQPLDAQAVAMVATPASIRRETGWLERGLYRIGQGLHRLASPLGLELRVPYRVRLDDVLETEEAIESARRIGLVQGSLPLANAGELLALEGTRLAQQVQVPAIVARPVRDGLVGEDSTRALYEALPEPRRWLELDGPHECFFDVTGRACAEDLVEALVDLLEPQAAT